MNQKTGAGAVFSEGGGFRRAEAIGIPQNSMHVGNSSRFSELWSAMPTAVFSLNMICSDKSHIIDTKPILLQYNF